MFDFSNFVALNGTERALVLEVELLREKRRYAEVELEREKVRLESLKCELNLVKARKKPLSIKVTAAKDANNSVEDFAKACLNRTNLDSCKAYTTENLFYFYVDFCKTKKLKSLQLSRFCFELKKIFSDCFQERRRPLVSEGLGRKLLPAQWVGLEVKHVVF